MRKHREKMRKDECFDIEKYHESERMRISKLRKEQKKKRDKDIGLHNKYKMKEKLRKREQRKKKISKKLIQSRAKRRNSTYEKDKTIQNLKFKVKMYDNFNRRLKRKIASTPVSLLSEEISGHSIDDNAPSTSISSVVLDCVSPSSKKRL